MAHYDAKVAAELGLLSQYPNKEGMGWPTYLVVSDPEGCFEVHGEVKGGLPKGEFRERLAAAAGVPSQLA